MQSNARLWRVPLVDKDLVTITWKLFQTCLCFHRWIADNEMYPLVDQVRDRHKRSGPRTVMNCPDFFEKASNSVRSPAAVMIKHEESGSP